jgi:uncharacterized protein
MMVRGYASIFNHRDDGDDIVRPGAFTDSIREWEAGDRVIPFLHNHETSSVIGIWKHIEEDDKGLMLEGVLLDAAAGGSFGIVQLFRAGALKGLSIGYKAIDYRHSGDVRELIKVKLVEVSLVACPMATRCILWPMPEPVV